MTDKNKSQRTIERLRKAASLGVKISAVHSAANVSEFRIRNLLATEPHYAHRKPTKQGLTEEEADAINAVLDGIKLEL